MHSCGNKYTIFGVVFSNHSPDNCETAEKVNVAAFLSFITFYKTILFTKVVMNFKPRIKLCYNL